MTALRKPSALGLRLLAVTGLLFAGCSGGENKPILKPTVKAAIVQDGPPQADGVVFFDALAAVGDTITLDVVVRDTTGTLDTDDVDLVLRYDATFIQVLSVSGQNTLFGNCNSVNPSCGVISPQCVHNRTAANGGGAGFCRSNGSTPCTSDADCTTTGDVCGSFGVLQAAFVVLTGPKTCANNPNRTCGTNSDCQLCSHDPDRACTTIADCRFCSDDPAQTCTMDADCGTGTCDVSTCVSGTCQGCPSVVVAGTQKIASLTLRVIKPGSGEFRFVVSADPMKTASFVRKDLMELPVLFFPNEDAGDPSIKSGAILITGTF